MPARQQTAYTIDGERLDVKDLLAKFPKEQHGRVMKRLARGARTWALLREPPTKALARGRARVNRLPGVLK